ncbi:putative multidrug resistance secretion protein (EmrA-like), partial [Methylorubrum extorquens DSM 13060]
MSLREDSGRSEAAPETAEGERAEAGRAPALRPAPVAEPVP